jgi:hypothetical protein
MLSMAESSSLKGVEKTPEAKRTTVVKIARTYK